jgi:hypothetical protein
MKLQLYEPGRRVDPEALEFTFSREMIHEIFLENMEKHVPQEIHEPFVDAVWEGMNLLIPSPQISRMTGEPITVKLDEPAIEAEVERRVSDFDEKVVDLTYSGRRLLLMSGVLGMAIMNGLRLFGLSTATLLAIPLMVMAGGLLLLHRKRVDPL